MNDIEKIQKLLVERGLSGATDDQLHAEWLRRHPATMLNRMSVAPMMVDEELRLEIARRWQLQTPRDEFLLGLGDDELRAECRRRFSSGFGEVHETTLRENDELRRLNEQKDRAHEALRQVLMKHSTEADGAFEIAPWVDKKLEELSTLKRLQKYPAMVVDADKIDAKAIADAVNSGPAAVLYRSVSRRLEMPTCGDACDSGDVRYYCTQSDYTNPERPVLTFAKASPEYQPAAIRQRVEPGPGIAATAPSDAHYVDPVDLLADDE